MTKNRKLPILSEYTEFSLQVNNTQRDQQEAQQILEAFQKSKEQLLSQMTISKANSQEEFLRLPPEERQFYIIDHDTGAIIDSRSQQFEEFQTEQKEVNDKMASSLRLSTLSTWQGYWEESKKRKQQMFEAVEIGDIHHLQLLLRNQNSFYINIDAQGSDGWTPLHLACDEGHLDICNLLIHHRANVNAIAELGLTPLLIACKRGFMEISKALIEGGAQINATDHHKNTSLHYAVQQANLPLIEFLINKGADLYIRNTFNMLPKDYCRDPKIQQELITLGYKLVDIYSYGQPQELPQQSIVPKSRTEHISSLIRRSKTLQSLKSFIVDSPTQDQKSRNGSKFQFLEQQFQRIDLLQQNKLNKVGPKSFKIVKELGSGSFGQVYLVQKIDTQKLYAVKVLKKQDIRINNLEKYAIAEKETMRIVKHPFIVNLNWAFQTQAHLMLVMDYCPGGDLSKLLDQKLTLPEKLVKHYVAEITLALECLHQNLIIYRDLKPDNIVIDEEGHALLTDFGLSRIGLKEGFLSKSFCGSPAYMAPEIVGQRGHYRTVDWYLLGVVTYEMLTGQPPYYDSDKHKLYQNITQGVLRLPKKISLLAQNFIVQLLDRNPMTRLGSKRDADDIKSHPWLADINWEACYQRQLDTLKPRVNTNPMAKDITIEDLFNNKGEQELENDHILGWSYAMEKVNEVDQ